MTASDPEPTRANTEGPSADAVRAALEDVKPIVLVGRIAELLPELSESELNALADAVEALTEAIGLRMDWSSSATGPESSTPPLGED